MEKRYCLITLVVAMLLMTITGAQAADLDDLFRFSNGGRPAGMGGAFVGVADDINAIYYNPAGLGILDNSQVSTMTSSDDFIDRTTNVLSYAHKLSSTAMTGAVGIKFALDDYGNAPIAVTVSDGRPMVTLGEEKETKYIFAYGRRIDEQLCLGASLKGVNYELGNYSATGWGLDVGALYLVEEGLSIGVNLQNIMETTVGEDSIPLNVKVGLAYKGLEENLTVAMDYDSDVAGQTVVHAGLDYQLTPQFAFRMGLDDENLTLGLGVTMSNLSLDYAFQEQDRGDQSVISLRYKIPTDSERKTQPQPVVIHTTVEAGQKFDTRVAVIEPGRVLINLGSSDGMSKGMTVNIYDGGKKVGESNLDLVGRFFSKGSFTPEPGVTAGAGQDVGDQISLP